MTREEIMALDGWRFDVAVLLNVFNAEKVFPPNEGNDEFGPYRWEAGGIRHFGMAAFGTSPVCDYSVLRHVRKEWDVNHDGIRDSVLRHVRKEWDVNHDGTPDRRLDRFLAELNRLLWRASFPTALEVSMPPHIRDGKGLGDLSYVLAYRPGMYSRAALLALVERDQPATRPAAEGRAGE